MIKKELLQQFLSENNFQIFWIFLGEKIIHGGSPKGMLPLRGLELSGVYTLNEGQVEGELKTIIAQPKFAPSNSL
jgi:hypothetical protein